MTDSRFPRPSISRTSISFIVFFVQSLLLALPSLAQWERLDRNSGLPEGVPAGAFYTGQTLFTLWAQSPSLSVSLYLSSDMGTTWSQVDGFTPVAAVPTLQAVVNGRIVLAALLGNATAVAFLISDDGGASWAYSEHAGLGRPTAIAYGNGRWYLSTASFLFVSTDDMQSWVQSSSGGAGSGILLTDNAGSLLANRSGLAYWSSDDGATWTAVTIPGNFLNYFSGAWQAGTTFFLKNAGDGQVHRSDDGGATWSTYNSFGDFNWASALVAADGNAWIPYAVSSGGANFFLSTDNAVTATAAFDLTGYPMLSGGTPCFGTPILTDSHLIASANLCFNDQNGIYRYPLPTDTARERRVEGPEALFTSLIGQPYPNPARSTLHVPMAGNQSVASDVRLMDMLGRTVRTWSRTATEYDVSDLPAGSYIIHVRAGGESATRPLVIAR